MEIALFVLGVIVSVPVGLLTNALYQRMYRPLALVQFDSPTAVQRGVGKFVALARIARGRRPPVVVDVITDGRFIDTAIFFLAIVDAAKDTSGTIFRLKQRDWDAVPHSFSVSSSAIAYMNRRGVDDVTGPVARWSNLCSFHGYALVGRPGDFPEPISSLEEANAALRRISASRRIKVVNFGSDSMTVLQTPLTPILCGPKVEYLSYAVDDGLARFLRGQGDLYIGGLPQRLECARRGMVELITSQNHPLMLGIDCLVFKGDGIDDDLLEKISASWSRICRRLLKDRQYCITQYEYCKKICKSLDISISFSVEDFLLVVHNSPGKYIKFFAGKDDAADELIRATNILLDDELASAIQRKDRKAIIEELHAIFSGKSAPNVPASDRRS